MPFFQCPCLLARTRAVESHSAGSQSARYVQGNEKGDVGNANELITPSPYCVVPFVGLLSLLTRPIVCTHNDHMVAERVVYVKPIVANAHPIMCSSLAATVSCANPPPRPRLRRSSRAARDSFAGRDHHVYDGSVSLRRRPAAGQSLVSSLPPLAGRAGRVPSLISNQRHEGCQCPASAPIRHAVIESPPRIARQKGTPNGVGLRQATLADATRGLWHSVRA
jgi:hypothetical protein